MNIKGLLTSTITCLSFAAPAEAAAPSPQPQALKPYIHIGPIPIIYQSYNDCGPASIAMVLRYYHLPADVHQISALAKPNPKAYMSVQQIPRFAQAYGLKSAHIRNSNLRITKQILNQGVPLIA